MKKKMFGSGEAIFSKEMASTINTGGSIVEIRGENPQILVFTTPRAEEGHEDD